MELNTNTITDMSFLSKEVYDDNKEYFIFDENGNRKKNEIVTSMGTVYKIYLTPHKETITVKGELIPLTSGMSVTAELKVGKRRIIEFFIYPLIKYLDEGMSVR